MLPAHAMPTAMLSCLVGLRLLLRQRSHHPLKSHQRHRIRRKRPQKARHKPPPIPLRSILHPNRACCILPPRKLPLPIPQLPTERIGHDALFDDIGGVGGEPVDLCGKTAGPKVDGRGGEGGVVGESGGEEVVGAPPEEEEGAEEQGGREAVVDSSDAVGAILRESAGLLCLEKVGRRAYDLREAVYGPTVEAVFLIRRVLDL